MRKLFYSNFNLLQKLSSFTLENIKMTGAVVWSQNDETLYISLDSGVLKIALDEYFRVSSAQVLKTDSYVCSVSIDASGKFLAAGCLDHSIWVWNGEDTDRVKVFLEHSESVGCVTFSNSESLLASVGTWDGFFIIRNYLNGIEVYKKKITSKNSLTAVAYDDKGQNYLIGDSAGNIFLIDTQTDKLRQINSKHETAILSIALNKNRTKFATGDINGNIYINGIHENDVFQLLVHDYGTRSMTFLDNEHELLSAGIGDGKISIWNLQKKHKLSKSIDRAGSLALAINSQQTALAVCGEDMTIDIFGVL